MKANRFHTAAVCLAIAASIGTSACRGKHNRTTVQNEEPTAAVSTRIESSLKMNDPSASVQLVKGFYGLESGSWRWTARNFTALLRPPLASQQRGATLTFSLTIPDVVIQKLSTVTLTASAGTAKLKSETYSKPGAFTFTADVPASELTKDTIAIDFALDKSLPAGGADTRDLGIIATAIGLESK